jgi:hypothetical protein
MPALPGIFAEIFEIQRAGGRLVDGNVDSRFEGQQPLKSSSTHVFLYHVYEFEETLFTSLSQPILARHETDDDTIFHMVAYAICGFHFEDTRDEKDALCTTMEKKQVDFMTER